MLKSWRITKLSFQPIGINFLIAWLNTNMARLYMQLRKLFVFALYSHWLNELLQGFSPLCVLIRTFKLLALTLSIVCKKLVSLQYDFSYDFQFSSIWKRPWTLFARKWFLSIMTSHMSLATEKLWILNIFSSMPSNMSL